MTTLLPQNTARLAWTVMLEEGQLGMLPEHRQRRRLNAARRLARIHVTRKARQLGMLADEWQERTIEGREDASLAVRVSARLTAPDIETVPTVEYGPGPLDAGGILDRHQQAIAAELDEFDPPRFGDGGEDLAAFQARINDMLVGQIHAQENVGIPARFLAGADGSPTSRKLERIWRDLADMEQQPTTIDEEHFTADDQLAELRPTTWVPLIEPGRLWTASNAGPQLERHAEAAQILARLDELMAEMDTTDPRGVSSLRDIGRHHLDAFRRLILHHHDIVDPAGADTRARARRIEGQAGYTVITEPAAAKPSDIERRSLASRYLAAIGQPQDGHVILGLEQVFTAPNLDHVRSWMVDAYPAMRDPDARPTRCNCGGSEWPAEDPPRGFVRAGRWAHRVDRPCNRMIQDNPQA